MFAVFAVVLGVLKHTNIRPTAGPLNWVFSTTDLHRWHHSRTTSIANSNYGTNLLFMDILFGTRYLPAGTHLAPGEEGMEMADFPQNYLGQLLCPFQWRKRVSNRASVARLEPVR